MELRKIKIKSIKKTERKGHVYDLSVTKNHNFFIGESETLTHNCDYTTANSQAALRNLMETFSNTTRFILTCNYVEKIIDPIQSRCQVFGITPPNRKEVAKRIAHVLDTEGVEYDLDGLATLINNGYPDIRRILNACQSHVVNGTLKIDNATVIQANYMVDLLTVLKSNKNKKDSFNEIRQIIADSKVKDFTALYKFLFEEIDSYADGHIASVILILAEAQYQESFAVDKEISVMATIIKILSEIK